MDPTIIAAIIVGSVALVVSIVFATLARASRTEKVLDLLLSPSRHEVETSPTTLSHIELARTIRNQQVASQEVFAARSRMQEVMRVPPDPFERPGIRISHRLTQATTISGDFYNVIPRGDGSVAVYLIDVEGHGLVAAEQAQLVSNVLTNNLSDWGSGPAKEQLEAADRSLSQGLAGQNIAVTMCFTEIYPSTMQVRHANAGMPEPFLFRRGQAQPDMLKAAGVYVGGGYSRYPIKPETAEVSVSNGDILILLSDGITEAQDSKGRLFGNQGVTAAVARAGLESPEKIREEILRAAKDHVGEEQPDDDQSLIVVQIGEPVQTEILGVKTLERREVTERGVEFTLMNADDTALESHRGLQKYFMEWMADRRVDQDRSKEIWVATWEAIQNAIKYGSRRGDVIHIRLSSPDLGFIEAEILQPLTWPDWDTELGDQQRLPLPVEVFKSDLIFGGTVVMLRLATEIIVSNQGRRIRMRFSV